MKISSILYVLLLATYAVHYQREALQLQVAYDRAVIELMQEANSDGGDPNPPTALERVSL
jgi:hypothetical protein